jgi:hypothetical protein
LWLTARCMRTIGRLLRASHHHVATFVRADARTSASWICPISRLLREKRKVRPWYDIIRPSVFLDVMTDLIQTIKSFFDVPFTRQTWVTGKISDLRRRWCKRISRGAKRSRRLDRHSHSQKIEAKEYYNDDDRGDANEQPPV